MTTVSALDLSAPDLGAFVDAYLDINILLAYSTFFWRGVVAVSAVGRYYKINIIICSIDGERQYHR